MVHQKSLEKEVERLKAKIASEVVDDVEADVKTVNNVKVLAKKVTVDQPAALRDLADRFKDKIQSGIVVLGSAAGNNRITSYNVCYTKLLRASTSSTASDAIFAFKRSTSFSRDF